MTCCGRRLFAVLAFGRLRPEDIVMSVLVLCIPADADCAAAALAASAARRTASGGRPTYRLDPCAPGLTVSRGVTFSQSSSHSKG